MNDASSEIANTPRRRYDSPVRRARKNETRERIVDAGSALVHEFESWDWQPLTIRAVAERAGVGERTVYRHFPSEQALHEAVMRRIGQESGVGYKDLTIDEIAKIGAKVFTAMSTFAVPSWARVTQDGVLRTVDERRKAALLAAVEADRTDWTAQERLRAAAALDVLWDANSYRRLVVGWHLDDQEATKVIDWMIGLVVDAIERDHRPAASTARGARPPSDHPRA